MRIMFIVAALAVGGCQSAPQPQPAKPASNAEQGPIEAVEAATGGVVERMHADGADWLALVQSDAGWELIRIRRNGASWNLVERTKSTEYYLWPTQ